MPKVAKQRGNSPKTAKVEGKRQRNVEAVPRNDYERFLYRLKKFMIDMLPEVPERENILLPQLDAATDSFLIVALKRKAPEIGLKADDVRSLLKKMLIAAALVLERNERIAQRPQPRPKWHAFKRTTAQKSSQTDANKLSKLFEYLHEGDVDGVSFGRWFPPLNATIGPDGRLRLGTEADKWYKRLGTSEQRQRLYDMLDSIEVPQVEEKRSELDAAEGLLLLGDNAAVHKPERMADASANGPYHVSPPNTPKKASGWIANNASTTDARQSRYADLAKSSSNGSRSNARRGLPAIGSAPNTGKRKISIPDLLNPESSDSSRTMKATGSTASNTPSSTPGTSPGSTPDADRRRQLQDDFERSAAEVRQLLDDRLLALVGEVHRDATGGRHPVNERSTDNSHESAATGRTSGENWRQLSGDVIYPGLGGMRFERGV
ncbi:uncharacterized protein AB675_3005 [Cyphellophora attinorum]|uniref:Uncharacterized protein n=1 Tax=Cyphellophora attinorum TaxID=1664694 RepID=A0A0N1H3U1_9EURO|nr:uncharacterized protein AB675_3005 [Phialophora attinorum]KPI36453.1 hypothetical protein AB675_3005 [Phialophora attinorum]